MRINYKNTLLIGLGFFVISLVWPIYNVAVPVYLEQLGLTNKVIGSVMTIDNIFAVVFLPIFGALSDKTYTRYGRRMPYLLLGIPLSAVAFFIIPFTSGSLPLLMLFVILLNFFMSIYRAPTVALMPDLTPAPLRSKANGIINLMGGIGSAIALLLGGLLFSMKEYYPFAAGSLILIAAIIIMYNTIQEPKPEAEHHSMEKNADGQDSGKPEKGRLLSLVFLLLAIFFWFCAYSAVETFFSLYGQRVLDADKSLSSFLLLSFSASFLICAIPAGYVAGYLGRRKSILTGLLVLLATFVSIIFVGALMKNILLMFVLLALGGMGWALVNINSYPMVVEMTTSGRIGKFTGYYYFFSMLASIASPIIAGTLLDEISYGFLFIYASVCTIAAFFFMMLVKHGEVAAAPKSGLEVLEHLED